MQTFGLATYDFETFLSNSLSHAECKNNSIYRGSNPRLVATEPFSLTHWAI